MIQLLEKDIEELIYNDLTKNDGLKLNENGFDDFELSDYKWFRQFSFGSYGISDILGYKKLYDNTYHENIHPYINIILIELKAVPLKSDHIDQILRYKTAIRKTLDKYKFYISINPILIAPSIESGHFILNSCDILFYTYNYDIDGVKFKYQGRGWYRQNHNYDILKQLKNG
jgi:hypothetical protein